MRVLCFAALAVFFMASLAFAGGTKINPLPETPEGFKVVTYSLVPASNLWLEKLPVWGRTPAIKDAKPYFESLQVKFPEGSYALYFPDNQILIVAAPGGTQDHLHFLLDS